MVRPLYKTVITIWSEFEPTLAHELSDLAREAEQGEAYCSMMSAVRVENPESDDLFTDGAASFFETITPQQ